MLWVWDIGHLSCAAVFGVSLSCACVLIQPQTSASKMRICQSIFTHARIYSVNLEHMAIMHTLHATAFMEPVWNVHRQRPVDLLWIQSAGIRGTCCPHIKFLPSDLYLLALQRQLPLRHYYFLGFPLGTGMHSNNYYYPDGFDVCMNAVWIMRFGLLLLMTRLDCPSWELINCYVDCWRAIITAVSFTPKATSWSPDNKTALLMDKSHLYMFSPLPGRGEW